MKALGRSTLCRPIVGLLQQRLGSNADASCSGSFVLQIASYAKKPVPGDKELNDPKIKALLKVLEDPPKITHLMSPEDRAIWEERTKEYSRKKMEQHRKWQKELNTRLHLKFEALEALPTDELRLAAMSEVHEMFPLNRHIFTDTPPKVQEKKTQAEEAPKGKVRLGTKRR